MNLNDRSTIVAWLEKDKAMAFRAAAWRNRPMTPVYIDLDPEQDLVKWSIEYIGRAGYVQLKIWIRDKDTPIRCTFANRMARNIAQNTLIPFHSEGESMSNEDNGLVEKSSTKQFKPGPLVTRLEFEAASAVIAQAIANDQYGNSQFSSDGDPADEAASYFRVVAKRFKDPGQIRIETEARLTKQLEELKEIEEKVAIARARLAEVSNPTHLGWASVTKYKVPSEEFALKVVRGNLIASNFESRTISANYPGADGVKADVMTSEPVKECSCKYEGYKFHTGDCARKLMGPC